VPERARDARAASGGHKWPPAVYPASPASDHEAQLTNGHERPDYRFDYGDAGSVATKILGIALGHASDNAFHLVLCGRFYMERIDHRFASHAFAGLETNRRCSGIHAYLTVGDQFFSPCANLDCRPIPASGFREIRGGRLARAKPLRYPKSVIATFLQRCLPSHESQCLRAGNRSVRADAADRLQAISAASSLDAV
jgi:hypothetical protein